MGKFLDWLIAAVQAAAVVTSVLAVLYAFGRMACR
jgi:hypothetical protein